jgi:hypothetical protein
MPQNVGARLFLPLTIPLISLTLAAFTLVAFQGVQNNVTLPIEVIGPDGYTRSVTVNASDVSGVNSLYLKAYSIGYPQHYVEDRGYTVSKASIRLNDGSWIDIDNTVAECEYPESEMLCITGPMHTIRFEIPISELGNLSDGANTIDFRFNYTEAGDRDADAPGDPSTGYRILDIELRSASGTDQIDGTSFVWDAPSSWSPPSGYDDSQSISEGENLWTRRDLLIDYWNGPGITASCADCHEKEGRDLRYFAFSNKSIVARSQFHGLTETQGKKIAAYIRSGELRDPETGISYDPPGRPWHPPYQPGPTATATRTEEAPRTAGQSFSEVSSQFWAAGAGNKWVLDHDSKMLPHLFPDGVSLDDVHTDSVLNVRELPIALQYPDWNEWLPEQHPIDIWGSDFTTFTDGSGYPGPWQRYQDESLNSYSFHAIRSCMDSNNNDASQCSSQIENGMKSIVNQTDNVQKELGPNEFEPGVEIGGPEADYDIKRWQAVKQWELIQTHDLMDESKAVFNSDAPPLGWPSPQRDVFAHASHLIDAELKGQKNGYHDPYFDTAWYDLQVVLNDGRGRTTGISPVDWKYHFAHIYETSEIDNWPQANRYIRSYVRLIQNANLPNPGQFRGGKHPEGWYLRHTDLSRLLRYPSSEYSNYPGVSADEIHEQIVRSWYEGAVVGNDWINACRDGGNYCIEDENTDADFITAWQPSQETNYANATLTIVEALHDQGVEPTVMDSMRNWGKKLWPNTTDPTWAKLFPVTQSISLNTGWNFVSSRADLSGISIDQVFSDVNGLAAVKDANGKAYLPQLNVNQIGAWSTSDGYKVHVENAQEATVTGDPVDRERPIELKEGWNLVPYYPHVPMDVDTAFSSIEDAVEVVRDEDGNEYVPFQGTNEIGDLVPGNAYAVYLTSDVTFVYPSPK